jgi:hypothetical protein
MCTMFFTVHFTLSFHFISFFLIIYKIIYQPCIIATINHKPTRSLYVCCAFHFLLAFWSLHLKEVDHQNKVGPSCFLSDQKNTWRTKTKSAMAFCWDLSSSPISTQITINVRWLQLLSHRLNPWYKLKGNICRPPLTHLTSWKETWSSIIFLSR